jgi:hypothetical protein
MIYDSELLRDSDAASSPSVAPPLGEEEERDADLSGDSCRRLENMSLDDI